MASTPEAGIPNDDAWKSQLAQKKKKKKKIKSTHIPADIVRARPRSNLLADEIESRLQDLLRHADQRAVSRLRAFDQNPVQEKVIVEKVKIHGNQQAAVRVVVPRASPPVKESGQFVPDSVRIVRDITGRMLVFGMVKGDGKRLGNGYVPLT